jgi:hypothetical protein
MRTPAACSLAKTRRVYAFTIPRERVLTRLGLGAVRWEMNRTGCCYQPFTHDPVQIERRVGSSGFRCVYEATTAFWLTQVHARDG